MDRLCPATLTTTLSSMQTRARILLADTILQRHHHRPHSSLYKLRIGATGFSFGFLNPEDESDMLSRNFGKKLAILAE